MHLRLPVDAYSFEGFAVRGSKYMSRSMSLISLHCPHKETLCP